MPDEVAVAEPPESPAYAPKRRPKPTTISKEMRRLLGEVAPLKQNRAERKTWAELIAKHAMYKALGGSFPHLKEIMDRTEGKVADRIAGSDGGPIGVDVILAGMARIYPREAVAAVEARMLGADDDPPPPLTDHDTDPPEENA